MEPLQQNVVGIIMKNIRGGASAKKNHVASRNPNAEMDANRENTKVLFIVIYEQ